jgi:glycosyltransferase involved in cell wall biosynthesis
MACGIPVIASPVEANKEIVDHNQNGFLANSKSEWLQFMKLLLESPVLRLKMGRAGRSKIVEEYSVKAVLPTIKKILEEVGTK